MSCTMWKDPQVNSQNPVTARRFRFTLELNSQIAHDWKSSQGSSYDLGISLFHKSTQYIPLHDGENEYYTR